MNAQEINNSLSKPIEYNEVSVCPHCGSLTEERFSGDEGWTFCSDGCGCLEGDRTVTKFECSCCGDLLDEGETCSCGEKEFNPEDND